MNNEQCSCKKLERLIYGDRPDQSDGIAAIVLGLGKSIHGTPEEPGGLFKRIEEVEDLAITKAREVETVAKSKAEAVERMAIERLTKLEEKQAFHNKIIYVGMGMVAAAKLAWELFQHFGK